MGEIGPKSQPNGFGPKCRFNLTPNLAPLGGVFYGKPSKRYFQGDFDGMRFFSFLMIFGVFSHIFCSFFCQFLVLFFDDFCSEFFTLFLSETFLVLKNAHFQCCFLRQCFVGVFFDNFFKYETFTRFLVKFLVHFQCIFSAFFSGNFTKFLRNFRNFTFSENVQKYPLFRGVPQGGSKKA